MLNLIPGDWKPIVSALIQPPASLLLIVLLALSQVHRRKRWAIGVIGLSTVLLWLSSCLVTAVWLQDHVLKPPGALDAPRLTALRTAPGHAATAIVVLGSGRQASAAEYAGQATLTEQGMVRLRYGVWLARQTGLPLAYSGGVGWAQGDGPTEAETAARIARDESGLSVKWLESQSRDTRENARATLALLKADQIRRIVLVTHASHMPRAWRAFHEAAGGEIDCVPAPLAFVRREDRPVLDWLPSAAGFRAVHALLHEWLGLLAGA